MSKGGTPTSGSHLTTQTADALSAHIRAPSPAVFSEHEAPPAPALPERRRSHSRRTSATSTAEVARRSSRSRASVISAVSSLVSAPEAEVAPPQTHGTPRSRGASVVSIASVVSASDAEAPQKHRDSRGRCASVASIPSVISPTEAEAAPPQKHRNAPSRRASVNSNASVISTAEADAAPPQKPRNSRSRHASIASTAELEVKPPQKPRSSFSRRASLAPTAEVGAVPSQKKSNSRRRASIAAAEVEATPQKQRNSRSRRASVAPAAEVELIPPPKPAPTFRRKDRLRTSPVQASPSQERRDSTTATSKRSSSGGSATPGRTGHESPGRTTPRKIGGRDSPGRAVSKVTKHKRRASIGVPPDKLKPPSRAERLAARMSKHVPKVTEIPKTEQNLPWAENALGKVLCFPTGSGGGDAALLRAIAGHGLEETDSGLANAACDEVLTTRLRLVLLYFSARWCPLCTEFDKRVCDMYLAFKASQEFRSDVEFVWVSCDATRQAYGDHAALLGLMAVPWQPQQLEQLVEAYKVEALPSLLVLDASDGELLCSTAREDVVGASGTTAELLGKWLQLLKGRRRSFQVDPPAAPPELTRSRSKGNGKASIRTSSLG